jgi:hypothetical protein
MTIDKLMKQFTLNDQFVLSLEHQAKRIRLVVNKADEELACRIETVKNLNEFLVSEEQYLFKGRLQLIKHKDTISIILKGKPIGVTSTEQFKNALAI